MSKTYEKTLKKKKKKRLTHSKETCQTETCVYEYFFQRTCGLFPFITLDRMEMIIFSPCLKLFSSESARHLSFVNSFHRDGRDVQRPLGVVQPVCWLGPPLQSWCGRQNWRRTRTSQRIVLPQRHGDLKWAPLVSGYSRIKLPLWPETNLMSNTRLFSL